MLSHLNRLHLHIVTVYWKIPSIGPARCCSLCSCCHPCTCYHLWASVHLRSCKHSSSIYFPRCRLLAHAVSCGTPHPSLLSIATLPVSYKPIVQNWLKETGVEGCSLGSQLQTWFIGLPSQFFAHSAIYEITNKTYLVHND